MAFCAGLGLCSGAAHAGAEPRAASPAGSSSSAQASAGDVYSTPLRASSAYLELFAPVALGRGLRFNNPYRLQSSLGKTPESLSLTASYFDLGLGAVWGSEHGIAHGGVVHWSTALQGIPQDVISVSYLALMRFGRAEPFLRAGVPIIVQPDVNAGLEGAFGSAYLVRSGFGLQGELVASLYYGAATIERKVTLIPVLSLELGVWVDYEVLP